MGKTQYVLFRNGATAPIGPGPPHYRGFTITLRHTTLCRTPLDKWSARRSDLYLTTHNTHKRQASMPPAGFAPVIPASNRPQTHALDRAATEIGKCNTYLVLKQVVQIHIITTCFKTQLILKIPWIFWTAQPVKWLMRWVGPTWREECPTLPPERALAKKKKPHCSP